MTKLTHKIDFVALISVTNANPNGDPLNGNRPREDYDGFGEISDVCIKRKIRNRLQDIENEKKENEEYKKKFKNEIKIFVQSDDRADDNCKSLKSRAKTCTKLNEELSKENPDTKECQSIACETWIDVRSFGQVFAFTSEAKGKKKDNSKGISIGIRGPVSIHQAVSVSPVNIIDMQIAKSVNGDDTQSDGMSSDRMGTKYRIAFGLYILKGSINCQLAEKTGFSEEDAELIKEALRTLFDNDASSARPEGSMEVCKLYWWKHNEKTPKTTTAQVHRSVKVTLKDGVEAPKSVDDYEITLVNPDGCVEPEIL